MATNQVDRRTPTMIAKDREAAVESMNDITRKKLGEIEKLINAFRGNNLKYYYKLGGILAKITDNVTVYTNQGYHYLETALEMHVRTMQRAKQFAREYSQEEYDNLVAAKHAKTEFQLNWTHVTHLLSLPTKVQREKWVRKAIKHMWNPKELAAQMKAANGEESTTEKEHKLPGTVHSQIRQMKDFTSNWAHKAGKMWNGDETNVFTNIYDEPPERLCQMDADNLAELAEVLPIMAALVKELTPLVADAVSLVDQRLEAVAAEEAQVEESMAGIGKEQRPIDMGKKRRRTVAVVN